MIGSLLAVAALQFTGQEVAIVPKTKEVAQIIAGCFVGTSMGKAELQRLPRLWRSLLTLTIALICLNLATGWVIHQVTGLDLATSLLGTVPGGMGSIPLLSEDFGADPLSVTLLQFFRMMLGIGLFPTVVAGVADKLAPHEADLSLVTPESSQGEVRFPQIHLTAWLALVFVTLASVLLNLALPAINIMVCAVIFMVLLKILFTIDCFPTWLRQFAQVLSGWYIASTIVGNQLSLIQTLLVPILITCLTYLIGCMLIGYLIHLLQPMTLKSGFMSAIPAGASDIALIAADLNLNNPDIPIIQVLRLIMVTSLFPQVLLVALSFFQ